MTRYKLISNPVTSLYASWCQESNLKNETKFNKLLYWIRPIIYDAWYNFFYYFSAHPKLVLVLIMFTNVVKSNRTIWIQIDTMLLANLCNSIAPSYLICHGMICAYYVVCKISHLTFCCPVHFFRFHVSVKCEKVYMMWDKRADP